MMKIFSIEMLETIINGMLQSILKRLQLVTGVVLKFLKISLNCSKTQAICPKKTIDFGKKQGKSKMGLCRDCKKSTDSS